MITTVAKVRLHNINVYDRQKRSLVSSTIEDACEFIKDRFPRSAAAEKARYYGDAFVCRYTRMLSILEGSAPGKLLSIGVSYGFPEIAAKKLGWSVVGTDYHTEKTDVYGSAAKDAGVNIELLDIVSDSILDADNVLKYGPFDMIWASEVFEHLPMDLELVVRELCQIVTPGGRILITVPSAGCLRNLRTLFRGKSFVEPLAKLSRSQIVGGRNVFENWIHKREPGYMEVIELLQDSSTDNFTWDVWLPLDRMDGSIFNPKVILAALLKLIFPSLRSTIFAVGTRIS